MGEIKNVQPIQSEMFRFYVRSVSQPSVPHLVDLESYKWAGQCDCEHFKFRLEPELSRGAGACDRLRCSHIKAARSYFCDEVLPGVAARLRLTVLAVAPEFQAQAIASAIYNSGEPDADKLERLKLIREHLVDLLEQICHEMDMARDPEKHEETADVCPL